MVKPGEWILSDQPVEINAGRRTVRLRVHNMGDRPIQIGSHFHFFEVNRAMDFDRPQTMGMHLNIPAGTAVRLVITLSVPTDEVLYGVFGAASPDIVSEACLRAGVPFQRISGDVGARFQPLDQRSHDAAVERAASALDEEAFGRLRAEGHALGLFVEGTRQRAGVPGRVQPGAAMVALQEGVPVLPAAIHGTQYWRVGNWHPISVVWGEPMVFEGLPRSGKGYREASALIQEEIHRLWRWLVELHEQGRPRPANLQLP